MGGGRGNNFRQDLTSDAMHNFLLCDQSHHNQELGTWGGTRNNAKQGLEAGRLKHPSWRASN